MSQHRQCVCLTWRHCFALEYEFYLLLKRALPEMDMFKWTAQIHSTPCTFEPKQLLCNSILIERKSRNTIWTTRHRVNSATWRPLRRFGPWLFGTKLKSNLHAHLCKARINPMQTVYMVTQNRELLMHYKYKISIADIRTGYMKKIKKSFEPCWRYHIQNTKLPKQHHDKKTVNVKVFKNKK